MHEHKILIISKLAWSPRWKLKMINWFEILRKIKCEFHTFADKITNPQHENTFGIAETISLYASQTGQIGQRFSQFFHMTAYLFLCSALGMVLLIMFVFLAMSACVTEREERKYNNGPSPLTFWLHGQWVESPMSLNQSITSRCIERFVRLMQAVASLEMSYAHTLYSTWRVDQLIRTTQIYK